MDVGMDVDAPAYQYRAYTDPEPETCDGPGCSRPAAIEVVGDPHLFCGTECADRTL